MRLTIILKGGNIIFLIFLILPYGTFLILRLLSTKILTLLNQNSTINCLALANKPASSCHIYIGRRSGDVVEIVGECSIGSFLNWRILLLLILLLFFSESSFIALTLYGITEILTRQLPGLSSRSLVNIISWHWNLLAVRITINDCYIHVYCLIWWLLLTIWAFH